MGIPDSSDSLRRYPELERLVAAVVTNKRLAHQLLTETDTARAHVDLVCTLSDEEWQFVVDAVNLTDNNDILLFADHLYTILHTE